MKIHSFITTFSRQDKIIKITEEKTVHQMCNVLKFEKGEQVYIGDGKNLRYLASILECNKKFVEAEILKEEIGQTNKPEIIIALATIKREAFEYALEKLTEVGVDGIIPIASDKTIKKGVNTDRAKSIIRESSEQSERIIMPVLFEESEFSKTLDYFSTKEDVQIIICDVPNTELPSKLESPKKIVKDPKTIVIFIGPEGGWSQRERLSAQILGIQTYTIGKTVLRAETAAIAIGFMAVNNKM